MDYSRYSTRPAEIRLLFAPHLSLCVLTVQRLTSHLRQTNYDVNQWPTFSSDPPEATGVEVDIFINSLDSPRAATMDYHLDMYLRMTWSDRRVVVMHDNTNLTLASSSSSRALIINQPSVITQLWTPDVYFINLKDAKYHDVTRPNVLMRITSEGVVFYSMRLKVQFTCQMNLRKFPFDIQRCPIHLSTYAHPVDALLFSWRRNQHGITHKQLPISQFTLESIDTSDPAVLQFDTGNFSSLSASFTLRRQNGYHILQTYVPTILIVCISWVSFWIEQTAAPARVTLGVTTLLTLTSLAAGVRSELPPVSYMKAIDIWIGTCMVFVFGALLEFVFVHYMAKKKKHRRSSEDVPSNTSTCIAEAKLIDRICRVVIPGAFLLFNLIYWCVFIA